MSVIEAFAHGLAVIATPVGAITDILVNEKNGLLVPVRDARALTAALERLITDENFDGRSVETRKISIKSRCQLRPTLVGSCMFGWMSAEHLDSISIHCEV